MAVVRHTFSTAHVQERKSTPNFPSSLNVATSALWENANIPDDPVVISNTVGTIAYADAGPNTRTTQVCLLLYYKPDVYGHLCQPSLLFLQIYVNLGDNSDLDSQGFAPFGRISAAGMAIFEKIYAGESSGALQGV